MSDLDPGVPSTLEGAAARLRAAYGRRPIVPLRDVMGPTDQISAYEIQRLNTQHWIRAGRKVTGRKIGLTAESVQKQLGVDQPDYGVLFEDMEIADCGDLLASNVLQPKAEAEVALVLKQAINDPDAKASDVALAVETAVAAIEVVDSRIADWKITFADTVADNGSAAYYVLGSEHRPLDGLDLWSCGMVLQVNERVVSLGAGAACLSHPLEAAAWLARTLVRVGDPLCAGDVLLTGALGPMVGIAPGDRVRATIGGLGTVGFTYRDDRHG